MPRVGAVCHSRGMPTTTVPTLLVVDDHAEFRRTVRQMFDSHPLRILEAASGEQALECVAAQHPDWVVMDLRMPGMGGVRATEAIRKLDPQARVIVISQFTGVEFREQALRAGALHFLDKADLPRLLEIIGVQPPPT